MQLKLNDWPPIASHLAFLLVGIAATNLLGAKSVPAVQIPDGVLATSFGTARLHNAELLRKWRPGTKFHLARALSGGHCRLSKEPLRFAGLDGSQATVWLPAKKSADFVTLADVLRSDLSIRLILKGAEHDVPECSDETPKVVYRAVD